MRETLNALRVDFRAGDIPLQRSAVNPYGRGAHRHDRFAKKPLERFGLCSLQEFGPTELVSPGPTVREMRLVRFLRSVAGIGVARPANARKQ